MMRQPNSTKHLFTDREVNSILLLSIIIVAIALCCRVCRNNRNSDKAHLDQTATDSVELVEQDTTFLKYIPRENNKWLTLPKADIVD